MARKGSRRNYRKGGNPKQMMMQGGNPKQMMMQGGNPKQMMMQGGNPKQMAMMQGGAGAAENAINVYGNTDQQHAMVGRGNEIAYNMSAVTGGAAPLAPMVVAADPGMSQQSQVVATVNSAGGATQALIPSVGGGVLTDVLVPTVLVAANHFYKRSRSSSKKRTYRRGGAYGPANLPQLEAQLGDLQTNGVNSSIVQNAIANPSGSPAALSTVNVGQLNATKGGKGCGMIIPVFIKSMSRKFYKKSRSTRRKSARKSRGKGRKGRK